MRKSGSLNQCLPDAFVVKITDVVLPTEGGTPSNGNIHILP